jgi:hypothetical protein
MVDAMTRVSDAIEIRSALILPQPAGVVEDKPTVRVYYASPVSVTLQIRTGKGFAQADMGYYEARDFARFLLKILPDRVGRCWHCDIWFAAGRRTKRRLDAKFCCDEHRIEFNSLRRRSKKWFTGHSR